MRKLLLILAASLGGTFVFAGAASATLAGPPTTRSMVVPATSDPVPRVTLDAVRTQAPLPRVTVVSGDTLSGIGARVHRSWEQLASFNHVANPNLIYVGDVEVIPPATYAAGPVSLPTTTRSYTPPVTHHYYSAPRYTPPAPVVHSTYVAPQGGGFKACVEMRESTDGRGSSNLYGFLQGTWNSLGRSGSPGSASPAEQSAAFDQLYARDGTSPWGPYDGC